jgi:hypothetical protein
VSSHFKGNLILRSYCLDFWIIIHQTNRSCIRYYRIQIQYSDEFSAFLIFIFRYRVHRRVLWQNRTSSNIRCLRTLSESKLFSLNFTFLFYFLFFSFFKKKGLLLFQQGKFNAPAFSYHFVRGWLTRIDFFNPKLCRLCPHITLNSSVAEPHHLEAAPGRK